MKKYLWVLLLSLMMVTTVGCNSTNEDEPKETNSLTEEEKIKQDEEIKALREKYEADKKAKEEADRIAKEEEELKKKAEEEALAKEEEIKKKEREESLITYAELIADIEADYPEMKVQHVEYTTYTHKNIELHMELLENRDLTMLKCAELSLMKETIMKDNGINSISIWVYNKAGVEQGLLYFKLENGSYEPILNTLI